MSYLAPSSLSEALALLRDMRPKVIAGCTDFYPARRPGGGAPNLMDITRVEGLRGIRRTAQGWRIGAATTWTDIVRADLPPAFRALELAAREVGSIQIQNAGTVAGNLCNASPAADGVPPLLALEAEVEIASPGGMRRSALGDFILGPRKVDLGPDEMVTAIHVPDVADKMTGAFLKLGSRKYLVISIVMVAAVVRVASGRIAEARVAVGACSPVARRLPAFEAALRGTRVEDVPAMPVDPAGHLAGLAPIDDVRGTAAYRLQAVAELCRRAVADAAGVEKRHG